jgi:acyl-CoA synthetase (AMP-forming)/AMP-acid ligase II
VVAFGTKERGTADRVVLVFEPNGTSAVDVLTDTIRRRISDSFGLYIDDIVPVPSGVIGRTTSGKVQRTATRDRYERGLLARHGAVSPDFGPARL